MGSKSLVLRVWCVSRVSRASATVCVLSVVAVGACNSTTTGSGSSGGGLFGNGSGNGAIGGMLTIPTSCSASTGDDACSACMKKSCCTSTLRCANDAECNTIVTCVSSCTQAGCYDDCISAHPRGQTELTALIACEQKSCVAACSGESTASGGAASETSGTP